MMMKQKEQQYLNLMKDDTEPSSSRFRSERDSLPHRAMMNGEERRKGKVMRQGKEKVMERGRDATSREVSEQLTDSGRKVRERERLALSPSLSSSQNSFFRRVRKGMK